MSSIVHEIAQCLKIYDENKTNTNLITENFIVLKKTLSCWNSDIVQKSSKQSDSSYQKYHHHFQQHLHVTQFR